MSLLTVEDLSLSFGGVHAVDGVTFAVGSKEVLALIGPNGAGKTSVFNLISRLYPADRGRIVFDGRDITRVAPHRIAALGIARTFQNIELFDRASVLDNLLLGRHVRCRTGFLREVVFTPGVLREECGHRRRAEEIIDFLDLQHYRDMPVAGLPYGVRKIVELGRALCAEPRLLLLDEPSSGLNAEETEDMAFWIEDIREEFGISVVLIEHDMGLVGLVSDRVLALNNGRCLAVGTPEEVRSHPEVARAYLGA